jgi:hypothetical protein
MIDSIKNKLEKIKSGVVFTASEFAATVKSPTTVSITLNDYQRKYSATKNAQLPHTTF